MAAADTSLPTRYDFAETEARIYQKWRKSGAMSAAINADGTVRDAVRAKANPFVIVIPPPNVTGRLHMGHALNNTIQDVLIRYHRMQGFDALWVPGTDHAGIATQTVVKKLLDHEGVDYRGLGREKFVERIWEWRNKYGNMILNQLERMGCSCDWSRTAFTMDKNLHDAVIKAFVALYDAGLIYRGNRIVNWCPVDQTALSDDEVETKEGGEPGFLWEIAYKLADGSGQLVVATTRPETLFGDVAVAVHPEDERYQHLIGKEVIVPLANRRVPVIADDYVDRSFGTGCLKITPAHDPNDFEVGARHQLTPINVMNADATMNENVPPAYRGLKRFACRKQALADLTEAGLLISETPRMTPVGRSYRSKEIIEYRLSEQWFVKMEPMAKEALNLDNTLTFHPPRWGKVYHHWLDNIRDWCISRQIWWGHRIPAWHHRETGEILVAESTPERVLREPDAWRQDDDVLDTWFSSALWPMAVMGWPEKTKDLARYFPTTVLSTAKDIIFFWVARMNFMAAHFEKTLPYSHVYIHPTIMDEKGETMSKSKGNGVDPLVAIEGASLEALKAPIFEARPTNVQKLVERLEKAYPQGFDGVGADALRFTLLYLCSNGQELKLSLDSFNDIGRRFVTKLWNAARFVFLALDQEQDSSTSIAAAPETAEDQWIRFRIQEAANTIHTHLKNYDFAALGNVYYHLAWTDFCDWYVELSKARLQGDDAAARRRAQMTLASGLADMLRLLHPLCPFITEELWSHLLPRAEKLKLWEQHVPASELLITEKFPDAKDLPKDAASTLARFATLQTLVGGIRTIRSGYQVKPLDKIRVAVRALDQSARDVFAQSRDELIRLCNISDLAVLSENDAAPKGAAACIEPAFEAYVDLAGLIDVKAEHKRLKSEIEKNEKYLASLQKKLENPNFLERAAPDVVADERRKFSETEDTLKKLREQIAEL